MAPSWANAMHRPGHGGNDVRSTVGNEPWWDATSAQETPWFGGAGRRQIANVAARHIRPRHRCSSMSTPNNWTAAAAADHRTAASSVMGPDSRRGGRGRTPSPGASSSDEQAGDHERKLVDIVDQSLGGQPQPQQQRSEDATDANASHSPEDRANRAAIVPTGQTGRNPVQTANEGRRQRGEEQNRPTTARLRPYWPYQTRSSLDAGEGPRRPNQMGPCPNFREVQP